MIKRTIVEWGALQFGPGDDQIPEHTAARLEQAARHAGDETLRGNALILGRNSIKARQIVGVVSTTDASLEILPKIGGQDTTGLRSQLIHMLQVAHDLPVALSGPTELGIQNQSVLEILIRRFATGLRDEMRKGLPHRYRWRAEDLPALRGRLLPTRQFTVLAATPAKLACEFEEFSADTPLNQILKAATARLSRISSNSGNQRLLAELLTRYASVANVPPSALPWNEVQLDRTNNRWHQLYQLAKLLLSDTFQTTSGGATEGFALLFEMNELFEAYIAKLIKREFTGSGYQVVAQGGLKYCMTDSATQRGAFLTKPDILIRKGKEVVAIVDTKWKHYEPGEKESSQADVYQMMAYAQVYECPRVTLLYPHNENTMEKHGVQRSYELAHSSSQLTTATVRLLRSKTRVLEHLPLLPSSHD